ncbi:hypothetical protein PV328_000721, partial [Microctonus aethiopoides]
MSYLAMVYDNYDGYNAIAEQDGSNDAKSLQGPPTKFVTSYLQPVVCEPPLLHIALREIFCLCVVKVEIFLTSEANQQNYRLENIRVNGLFRDDIYELP